MTPVLPLVGLLSLTGMLYLLPFLPALSEWRRRGDAAPLPIIRTDLGDTGHFARRFRAYLQSQMPELEGSRQKAEGGKDGESELPTAFCLLPSAYWIRGELRDG